MLKNNSNKNILFEGIEKWCDDYTLSSGGSFLTLCCERGFVHSWCELEEIEKEYGILFVHCNDFGTFTNFTFRVNPVID